MGDLFKKSKRDFIWVTSCIAYLVGIFFGALWVISQDRWRICLYVAVVFIVIGMIELFIMGMVYVFEDPFEGPREEISEEVMEKLKQILDSMEEDK